MRKICIVDLAKEEVVFEEYDIKKEKYCGRSLASYLVFKHTSSNTDRLSDDNVIVLTPGLFTGTFAPSTGRLVVATKKAKGKGFQISNMTGDFPQKLASIGIEALVIKGKAKSNNTILYVGNDRVEIVVSKELNKPIVPDIITYARNRWGSYCGIVGTGIAADYMMPLATVFSTYPLGTPEYYCSRGGFGDVWGSKNLKAIVVASKNYFGNPCHNKEEFIKASKALAKIIINDPICGKALPSHGSITLIKLLNEKITDEEVEMKKEASKIPSKVKMNKTCTPLCVIGCLNRHCSGQEEAFSAPAESEVYAALIHCYNMDDSIFSKVINKKAFELGIDSTEFVFTSKVYYEAIKKVPSKDEIYSLLLEIEKNTLLGRVIASKTQGVYSLYKDNENLENMVTKPVINEESEFSVKVDKFFDEFKDISTMELMYNQIFVLENLGFCIFAAFALVNNKEAMDIMAEMYYHKTGIKLGAKELIEFAGECIDFELNYEKEQSDNAIKKNIPEFTKVLYRYFS